MPHNSEKRGEAAAQPLILFGEFGRVVEGYRPADEDLALAQAPVHGDTWKAVEGPHLRIARRQDGRNKTGVLGVSISRRSRNGPPYVYVQLGRTNRRFNIAVLGFEEAFRRAVALRRDHERKIAQANALIISARERNSR